MRLPLQSLFESRSFSLRDPALAKLFSGGTSTAAGISVNEDSAYNIAAFFQGVGLISGHFAGMPLDHLKKGPSGRKTNLYRSNVARLFNKAPNPEMTPFVFRETLQSHLLSWGNAYAEIQWDNNFNPIALWPITPDRMTVYRDAQDKRIKYRIAPSQRIVDAWDMLHIPGLGFDGLIGYSVIARARQSLGLMAAAERYGATFYGNGAHVGAVMTIENDLSDEQEQELRGRINRQHQGPDKAHSIMFLSNVEGMKYERMTIPPNDAQFLDTRKFQLEEIARWLNLPPHKLKDLDRSTFSNIEQQSLDYLIDTLWPWLERWEDEITRKLISRSEWNLEYVKFNFNALLRGDIKSRYDAYNVGKQAGFLSTNDIREKEDLDPIDGGDVYQAPLNAMPLSLYKDYWDKKVNPPEPKVVPPPADPTKKPGETDPSLAEAQDKADKATKRAELAEAAVAEAQRVAAERQGAFDALQASATATTDDLATKRREVNEAKTQVDQLRILSAETTQRAAELQTAIEAERAARAEQAKRAEEAQATRVTLEATLETERAQREQERADLTRKLTAAKSTVRDLTNDVTGLRRAVETRQENDKRVANELTRVRTDLAGAIAESARLRTELSAVQPGQADVARRLADAETSRADLEGRLASIEHLQDLQADELEAAQQALASAEAKRAEAMTAMEQAQSRVELAEAAAEQARSDAETSRNAEQARVGQILVSHRALIADIMRRMIERELDRAQRAQGSPEKFRSWLETFYAGHEDLCTHALLPAVRVHVAWSGSGEDPERLTYRLVREHVEESKRQLAAVADGDADEIARSMYALAQRWMRERTETIATTLLQDALDRRRS